MMPSLFNHRIAVIFMFSFLVVFDFQSVLAQQSSPPKLLRVELNSGKVLVGQVLENGETAVRLYDLVSNQELDINKSDVKAVVNPLDFDEAVRTIGLPRLLSWRIRLLSKQRNVSGAIAQITPQTVYVTLGSSSGVQVGNSLAVYRNKGEIKDPKTGEVLAIERPLISELEVIEVNEKFSKARISSKVEVALEVGDEVESKASMVVAVSPILTEGEGATNVGSSLAEEITTSLVQAGTKVVERSVLDKVLPELIAQNTILFDSEPAKKLGQLTGASYVVTGKIVRRKTSGTAFVRLVDVGSGEILLAVSSTVNMSSAAPISPNTSPSSSNNSKSGANTSGKLGNGRSLPNFLTSSTLFSRTQNHGIRLKGADEFSISKQGSVRTKEANYLDRDFTFEVLVDFNASDFVANIGLGPGVADRSYNGLKDSVYIRLHPLSLRDALEPGVVKLNRFRLSDEKIGEVSSEGPYMVRIIKEDQTVTFQIDPGNDGPTDDDLETTIVDIREAAPFFNSKNCPLFFGGSGEFLSISIK